MYSLPLELQRNIYSFDPTYRKIYDNVMKDIIPIQYYIMEVFLENDFEEFEFSDLSSNRFTFGKNGEIYDEVIIYNEDEIKTFIKNELFNQLYRLKYIDIVPFLKQNINLTEELYNHIKRNYTTDTSEFVGSLLTNIEDCIITALSTDRLLEFCNYFGCFEYIFVKNKRFYVKYENI